MFYDTSKNDHGLPHNPFKAIVAPRPIGWITTIVLARMKVTCMFLIPLK